ncbi:MAG: YggS family pyridoxal phosphate-dependent enzyme [Deltaproteobacteria bacterium]|nr:YggS family pyridoxal phosphate-dependent enzyme [Deltaproteobacteria bacterium]
MTSVAARLAEIRARIAAACGRVDREPATVRLVAVCKKQSDDRIAEAIAAGQRVFGDNYVQELDRHHARFPDPSLEWHLIGHLQSNKARRAAEAAAMIHSVDSLKLVRTMAPWAAGRSAPLPILVEVSLAGEVTKTGCSRAEVASIVRYAHESKVIQPAGLMCMPPPDRPARPYFVELRQIRDRLRDTLGLPLPELSMGMSGDFEEAIEEGATLVRIGTAVFGARS